MADSDVDQFYIGMEHGMEHEIYIVLQAWTKAICFRPGICIPYTCSLYLAVKNTNHVNVLEK